MTDMFIIKSVFIACSIGNLIFAILVAVQYRRDRRETLDVLQWYADERNYEPAELPTKTGSHVWMSPAVNRDRGTKARKLMLQYKQK